MLTPSQENDSKEDKEEKAKVEEDDAKEEKAKAEENDVKEEEKQDVARYSPQHGVREVGSE